MAVNPRDPLSIRRVTALSDTEEETYMTLMDHADPDGVFRFVGSARDHKPLPSGATVGALRALAKKGCVHVVTITHNYWDSPTRTDFSTLPHVLTEVHFGVE